MGLNFRGPFILFNVFINDLNKVVECALSLPTVQNLDKLFRRDLDGLEPWAGTNHMKFNKDACQILRLEKCDPGYKHRMGGQGQECRKEYRGFG